MRYLLILLLAISMAGYIPEHILFSKWCQDVTKEVVKTDNEVINKLAQYSSMMASHIVVDRFIGEHQQGKWASDLTLVNTLQMFFATPEESRFEFMENFIFGWFIPDVLFKKEFHSHGLEPIFKLDQDQSILLSNVVVMLYTVRVNFNIPLIDVEVDL